MSRAQSKSKHQDQNYEKERNSERHQERFGPKHRNRHKLIQELPHHSPVLHQFGLGDLHLAIVADCKKEREIYGQQGESDGIADKSKTAALRNQGKSPEHHGTRHDDGPHATKQEGQSIGEHFSEERSQETARFPAINGTEAAKCQNQAKRNKCPAPDNGAKALDIRIRS